MARKPGEVFPSDRRRWFRLYEDLLDDPALNSVAPDVFRFYVRLLAMLNRTKQRDGTIRFDRFALNACAMREQRRHALSVARSGAEAGLFTLSEEGADVLIQVPKWAELQGVAPAEPRRDPSRTPPTKTKTKTKTKTTPKPPSPSAPAAAASRGSRRSRSVKIDPRVLEVWPRIREAFAAHGRSLGEQPGADRSKLIAARLDEGATEGDLVAAVHGYVNFHGALAERDGFDARKYFRPSTVFKRDGFSDRVELGAQGRSLKAGPSKAERLWGLR